MSSLLLSPIPTPIRHLEINHLKVLNALNEATFDAFLSAIARVEQAIRKAR